MKNDLLLNLVKAQTGAAAETEILQNLNQIRSKDLILFTKTLIRLGNSVKQKDFESFLKELELSNEELASLLIGAGKARGQTQKEIEKEVEQIVFEDASLKPKQATAEELFTSALEALHSENPKWTPYSFKRFAESRIKKYLEKDPKPYTEQDVTVGANWFNSTRKLLTEEKQINAPRARRYAQVPRRKWQEFYEARFRTKTPEFARDFEKTVRAKAQELQNTTTNKIR